MGKGYVVDTHALIWYLGADSRLGSGAKAAFDEVGCTLYLPVIALAEACWLVEHNRTNMADVGQFLAAIDKDERIVVADMDREIVEISNGLRAVGEMHDRQIVATALRLIRQGMAVAILTKDADISASGAAPVVW